MAESRSRIDPEGSTLAAPLAPPAQTAAGEPETDEAPQLVGGRYEILGMLGSGGMGTVYRARDRELSEVVALKVLRKELASSGGMIERFRREVKLARRVTHRNVARTFDIGAHEGERFLTMELIEGEMLGAYLARRGRLPLRDVVHICVDLCAGLAAAHAAGVLHRDLKPENVILTNDGRAVITDFGIARAASEGERGRTMGGIVGTPAYMAPEQVEGASDLDGRADLYALGAIMFELLTGTPAWPGDSAIAVAAARLLRPPSSVRALVPELPEAAAQVVLTLMARARDERFASAAEAGERIAALGADDRSSWKVAPASEASPGPFAATPLASRAHKKSLAVLPLVNLGDPDDEYLVQTVTEDLVDLLSVVPELRVRPRGDGARFSRPTRDVREAGRELGVDVVVDGSLRRMGVLVRASIRLITVEDGFQLWARRFDAVPAEVLSIADQVAAAVASALLSAHRPETRPLVHDPEAQDRYLRGRYLLHHGWFEESILGVRLLQEAHKLAPDDHRIAGTYALAVARVLTGDADYDSVSKEARDLAERTLEHEPRQTEARVALGFIHLNAAEGAAAAAQLRKALTLSPHSMEALDALGRMQVEIGRHREGLATLRRALAVDPTLAHAKQAMARTHALLGEYDTADEVLGPTPEHPSELASDTLLRVRIALWRRDTTLGQRLADAAEKTNLPGLARGRLSALLHAVKSRSVTPELTAEMEAALPMHRSISLRRSSFHGQIRTEVKLAAGETRSAMADLRQSDANGLLDLLWLDRCPLMDDLRETPDFVTIRENTAARADRVARALDA
jgi:serine/threonine-protein kinase